MDTVVEDLVVVEFKTVEKLLPVHDGQVLSYLTLSGLSVGLLINFHVSVLKDGLRRIVNHFGELSASPRLCG
jgi:GxxExxY protein